MQAIKQKVTVRHLMPGDRLGTGETVLAASRGARTPAWGASTTITVSRATDPVASKVAALGALLSELSAIALDADRAALLAPHIDALCSALAKHQLICACVAEPGKEGHHEQ